MCQFDSFFTHFLENADRIRDTGFEYIVGVDQKCTGIRVHLGVSLECSVFIREAHDPAVGVCTKYRNIEHLTGQNIGSSGTSADYCGTCTIDTCVWSLCTAKTKFHDPVTACRIADTSCFGSDKALVVDDIEDCGLDKLCFHDRSDNFDKRLSWEYDSSFRNCVDISGKTESAQIFQEIFFKNIKTSEVINIFCFKVKILDILDHLFQTCCDREASPAWIDTIEHVEDNSLVGWVFEITLHHR